MERAKFKKMSQSHFTTNGNDKCTYCGLQYLPENHRYPKLYVYIRKRNIQKSIKVQLPVCCVFLSFL